MVCLKKTIPEVKQFPQLDPSCGKCQYKELYVTKKNRSKTEQKRMTYDESR